MPEWILRMADCFPFMNIGTEYIGLIEMVINGNQKIYWNELLPYARNFRSTKS